MIRQYTDIGHKAPDDIIWLWERDDLLTTKAVTSRGQTEPHSHWRLWGSEAQEHWKGRFEEATGFCSIAPPYGEENTVRPPSALLDALVAAFKVARFYYFRCGDFDMFTRRRGTNYDA